MSMSTVALSHTPAYAVIPHMELLYNMVCLFNAPAFTLDTSSYCLVTEVYVCEAEHNG